MDQPRGTRPPAWLVETCSEAGLERIHGIATNEGQHRATFTAAHHACPEYSGLFQGNRNEVFHFRMAYLIECG